MKPRVLIVGTIPYNPNTSSRAFDAYFHNWDRGCVRQIFSNPKAPIKGHCSSLYQITDAMMLKRRFNKKTDVGTIYNYDDCVNEWKDQTDYETHNKLLEILYKLGKNKTPLNYLFRRQLWKKKYWQTEKLNQWLDEYKPECVFLAFSDDFFINEIALFVADRFSIPLMCCIGDDYYFNNRKSISPFYHIYRAKYKKLVDNVFSHKCSAIYISDKIRDKYNDYFGIKGETVYLTSNIKRNAFKPISLSNPLITYCGNVRLGRNQSLVDIGKALQSINPAYRIEVYSAEKSKRYLSCFKKTKNVVFKGALSYSEVVRLFEKSDLVLIVEGFKKKDVNYTRYSLSTKAADSISSGCSIFTYGSPECGVVDYMSKTQASAICTNSEHLIESLKSLFGSVGLQLSLYENGNDVLRTKHNLNISNKTSEKLINDLIKRSYE